MNTKRVLRFTLSLIFFSILSSGVITSFAIPPSAPAPPPGGMPQVEPYEILVYFGDFIPNELLDGVIGEEWDDAGAFLFMIDSYEVIAYLKHDGQYLYIALVIATGREFRNYSEAYVWFDNNDGKEFDSGDDMIDVEGGLGVLYEADFYYADKYDFRFDPAEGGINNAWGIGAYNAGELSYMFEFVRELSSGDPLDVPLDPEAEAVVIFGFVGEASPPFEVMSKKFKVKVVSQSTKAVAEKIAKTMDKILGEVKQNLGISKPPKPEVHIASTNTHYNMEEKRLYVTEKASLDTIKHEYGHFLMQVLYGDKVYKDKFREAGEDHCPTSEYSASDDKLSQKAPSGKASLAPIGAFSEAVATWLAACMNKDKVHDVGTTQMNLETNEIIYTWLPLTATATPAVSGDKVKFTFKFSDGRADHTGPLLDSSKVESTIAAALWDITDGTANSITDDDTDGLSIPIKTVLTAMANKGVQTFKELIAELKRALTEEQKKALDKILKTHGLK